MGEQTGRSNSFELDERGVVRGWRIHRLAPVADFSAPSPVDAPQRNVGVDVYNLPLIRPSGGATPVRMFDIMITQTCADQRSLILPAYPYGGLGLRGRGEWFGAGNASFLLSGRRNRPDQANTNARAVLPRWRCRWCVGWHRGAWSSRQFRAPQTAADSPDRAVPLFSPSQLGDWAIEPGKPYVARYRFIVADGRQSSVA